MNCELYQIRKQLEDLQKRLDSYERNHVDSTMSEHQRILESIEKRRLYDKGHKEQKREVD